MPKSYDHSVLRRIRIERKLSQQELADKAGTYQHIISKLETGSTKEPSLYVISQIANFFQVPIEVFLK